MRVDIIMKQTDEIYPKERELEKTIMIFKNIDLSHVYYILDLLRLSDKYNKETCHFEIREHKGE